MNNYLLTCMPYCLARQPDGRWVALNRGYKPVGMFRDHVGCDRTANGFYLDGRSERKLRSLDDSGAHPDRVFLYTDESAPASARSWKGYSRKLEILSSLKISWAPITKAQRDKGWTEEIRAKHVADAIKYTGCTEAEAAARYRNGDCLLINKDGTVEWLIGKGVPLRAWRD